MSLVGSLEDLGLADILQIVSLSRKSGMLSLRSEGGDGRILLKDGLVQGAAIKGGPEDLRGLLVGGRFASADDFDRARESRKDDESLEAAVIRECGLPAQHLESLRREHVERSVMRMFSWRSGEFSFEIRDAFGGDNELMLPTGLNTQYLAMEATRLGDERIRTLDWEEANSGAGEAEEAEVEFSSADADGEIVFSGEQADPGPATDPEPEEDAVETLALAAAQHADGSAADSYRAEPAVAWDDAEEPESSLIPVAVAASPESTDVPVSVEPVHDPGVPLRESGTGVQSARHLVAVDPDLSSLEWLKASVESLFQRVHIFQRPDIAIERIRQYLVRGEVPIVVVSEAASGDSGGEEGFVQRLRALAPTMTILALRPEGSPSEISPELDGVVPRPAWLASEPDGWDAHASVAAALREGLQGDHGAGRNGGDARSRSSLARLKQVSDRLRDPSTQGEVLSVVLEYAAESFCRVVMFMLRDGSVGGIAQIGLLPTGGPDDEALHSVVMGPDEMPELFQTALERLSSVRSTLIGPRDRALALRLGAAAASEAYAAPIESGGCVVALLYADNLTEERPIPDTTALEIVLHEAGLALDRALLERALAERDE